MGNLTPTQKRNLQRRLAKQREREAADFSDLRCDDVLLQNFNVVMARLVKPVTEDHMTLLGRRSMLTTAPIIDPARHPDLAMTHLRGARVLSLMESSSAQKMHPRSYYRPEVLHQQLDSLRREVLLPQTCHLEVLYEASKQVGEELALSYEPLTEETALACLLARRVDTSAGAPYWAHRDVVCYPYLSEAWRNAIPGRDEKKKAAWEKIGSPDILQELGEAQPYTLNYRVEASADPNLTKHRIVWAAPMASQILEAKFAVPVQLLLAQVETAADDEAHGSFFSYMPTQLLYQRMMHMRKVAMEMETPLISMDYSAFDQHVPVELIELAFDCLQVPRTGVGAVVRQRFIEKKLVEPWNQVSVFRGMVPSGSLFTNLVDGVVNAIIQRYIALRLDVLIFGKVNGDDGVLVSDQVIDIADIEEIVSEVGMVANQTKQVIGRPHEGFSFCQNYWGPEFSGPVPSINKMANSLSRVDTLNFREEWSEDTEIVRTLQILELCRDHPLLEVIIDRCECARGRDGMPLLDYRSRLPRAISKLQQSNGISPELTEIVLPERYAFLDQYLYTEA